MVWIYNRAYHNAFCRRDKIYIGSTDHNLERDVTKKRKKKKKRKEEISTSDEWQILNRRGQIDCHLCRKQSFWMQSN